LAESSIALLLESFDFLSHPGDHDLVLDARRQSVVLGPEVLRPVGAEAGVPHPLGFQPDCAASSDKLPGANVVRVVSDVRGRSYSVVEL
jgi:hypothetical protein